MCLQKIRKNLIIFAKNPEKFGGVFEDSDIKNQIKAIEDEIASPTFWDSGNDTQKVFNKLANQEFKVRQHRPKKRVIEGRLANNKFLVKLIIIALKEDCHSK